MPSTTVAPTRRQKRSRKGVGACATTNSQPLSGMTSWKQAQVRGVNHRPRYSGAAQAWHSTVTSAGSKSGVNQTTAAR